MADAAQHEPGPSARHAPHLGCPLGERLNLWQLHRQLLRLLQQLLQLLQGVLRLPGTRTASAGQAQGLQGLSIGDKLGLQTQASA